MNISLFWGVDLRTADDTQHMVKLRAWPTSSSLCHSKIRMYTTRQHNSCWMAHPQKFSHMHCEWSAKQQYEHRRLARIQYNVVQKFGGLPQAGGLVPAQETFMNQWQKEQYHKQSHACPRSRSAAIKFNRVQVAADERNPCNEQWWIVKSKHCLGLQYGSVCDKNK